MFQFPSLPPRILFYSDASTSALPLVGFPIRKSRDQRSVSTSSGLIAAAHVLHRLLAPRHPPCALSLLIVKNTLVLLWSFRGARGDCRPNPLEGRPPGPVSQNSTAFDVEVDVDLGELASRTLCPEGQSSRDEQPPE